MSKFVGVKPVMHISAICAVTHKKSTRRKAWRALSKISKQIKKLEELGYLLELQSDQIVVANNYGHEFLDLNKVDNATTESIRRATGDDKITWKDKE